MFAAGDVVDFVIVVAAAAFGVVVVGSFGNFVSLLPLLKN